MQKLNCILALACKLGSKLIENIYKSFKTYFSAANWTFIWMIDLPKSTVSIHVSVVIMW